MTLFDEYLSKPVKDLKAGDRIRNVFKVLKIEKRTKKNGEPFLSLELMDPTGKIGAKIWSQVDTYLSLIRAGALYRFSGTVNEYQNQPQLKIDSLNPIAEDDPDVNRSDFDEQAPFDVDGSFAEMMETVKKAVSNPYLIRLADEFETKYGGPFRDHYGAQKIHHAYAGGLLRHTHSTIRLAVMIADFYGLDRELMVIGALFHDIGKLLEFTRTPAVETTPKGGLIGHIILGSQIFLELQAGIDHFPPDLCLQIQHLIVSHHGEREFGAPEVPKTPEAFALHIIDLLDSKLTIFREAIDAADRHSRFSEYNRILGRRLFVPEDKDKK
jgi:3'-5' exoribonuclease